MWLRSNSFSKYAVFALIVALLVSGSVSGLHASVDSTQLNDSYKMASTQLLNVDGQGDTGHHPGGEQECHNAQCNAYSQSLSSYSDVVSYARVEFSILIDQFSQSLIEFLYRPPKS